MSKDYTARNIQLRNKDNQKATLIVETFRESKKLEDLKIFLLKNIDNIVNENWGKFGKDFLVQHIVRSDILKIVRHENEIVAIASATHKKYLHTKVLYLEFTVVNQKYQGYSLSTRLNADMIVDEYKFHFIKYLFFPLTAVTITRNMRVAGAIGKFASYIYPNPATFGRLGTVNDAPDKVWLVAKELLAQSWNPKRKLLREGNVLIGSYENTPWLITDISQRHYSKNITGMYEKYLELSKKSDREFIFFARFNVLSIFKYLLWVTKSIKAT
jgi:hypothetical protein